MSSDDAIATSSRKRSARARGWNNGGRGRNVNRTQGPGARMKQEAHERTRTHKEGHSLISALHDTLIYGTRRKGQAHESLDMKLVCPLPLLEAAFELLDVLILVKHEAQALHSTTVASWDSDWPTRTAVSRQRNFADVQRNLTEPGASFAPGHSC